MSFRKVRRGRALRKHEVLAEVVAEQSAAELEATVASITAQTSTDIASSVDAAVAALAGSAPAALDTIAELAAALNDDANFATTVTNSIAAKASSNNPTFSVDVAGVPTNESVLTTDTVTAVGINAVDLGLMLISPPSDGDIVLIPSYFDGNDNSSITSLANVPLVVSNSSFDGFWTARLTLQESDNSSHQAALAELVSLANQEGLAPYGVYMDSITYYSLSSVEVSGTELAYLDGVTSSVQTQLDGKQATITGGATTITGSNLTTSRALVSDGSGKVAVSAVTATELGYVDGVTSSIQTQLNAKVGTVNGTVTTAATGSTVVRNITLSTADPSGGVDGQVWLKYTN